jgi:hypothetical protein
MIRLELELEREKAMLNKLIEENNLGLNNDFILEQSRKVDKIIVKYQKVKLHCIKKNIDKGIKAVRLNV